jgi:hypothetical protein
MPAWIMALTVCGLLAVAPLAIADENKSIGQTFGEAGRAIVDDSRSAYESSKDFAVETGQSISEDAQEAYEEGKHIGPKIAEDIKKGFQGGGHAPNPTNAEDEPADEKP